MKSVTLIASVVSVVVLAGSAAFAESGAPGSTPGKPGRVTTVPPPPPPGGPDKLTTRSHPPRPGIGDFAAEIHGQKASKSYCYTSEGDCTAWLAACMGPQQGSFSCAAGPGDNGQYVCVCVRH